MKSHSYTDFTPFPLEFTKETAVWTKLSLSDDHDTVLGNDNGYGKRNNKHISPKNTTKRHIFTHSMQTTFRNDV